MTQEEKDLLIKDLCGRLTHGVKCKILETNEVKILGSIQYDGENTLFDFWEDDQKIQYGHQLYLSEFKPYLLPISSMNEEQKREFLSVAGYETREEDCGRHTETYYYDMVGHEHNFYPNSDAIDWCDKNHFDYRGLIPMGLVDNATNLNIY